MVTRMDPQKGVDLSVDALRLAAASDNEKLPHFKPIFLGTGSPTLENSAT